MSVGSFGSKCWDGVRKANALGVTPIEGNGRGRIGPGELSGSDADLTKFPQPSKEVQGKASL